jgi:hypothetical protein
VLIIEPSCASAAAAAAPVTQQACACFIGALQWSAGWQSACSILGLACTWLAWPDLAAAAADLPAVRFGKYTPMRSKDKRVQILINGACQTIEWQYSSCMRWRRDMSTAAQDCVCSTESS